jgi:xanthine dehydrogenase accessory factor
MKEQKTILHEFKAIDFTKRKAALATVVKVRGSSYRSPGARMLITDDGRWVGSISGGCLEGDALRKARQVMTEQKPLTVTYDTREESNQKLGIGLGCNGVIEVLIEPLTADANTSLEFFEQILTRQQPVALATVFGSSNQKHIAEKLLISDQAIIMSTLSADLLKDSIHPELNQVFDTQRSGAVTLQVAGESFDVFVELIQPTISLILFGGGFDARPVSQMAKALGWDVTVTDECVSHIAPVFFPTADKLTLCQREFLDREFNITPFTACVLMSHNYEYDRDVLKKILSSPTPYIGILGPLKRFVKMRDELEKQGIVISAEDMHRIHAPIGLDIGAETPDEIALSILAEIQGKFSNRSGGFLKYRSGPIHHRDTAGDQVFKQVYLQEPISKAAQ